MNVTCVTSRYLPNLRYIARLLEVDCAIVLDLAPLPHQNKNSFVSRNRLIDKSGHLFWVSLPIHRKGIKLMKDARIDETNHNWIERHIRSIAQVCPNHKKVAGDFLVRLKKVIETSDGTLTNINSNTLNLILELLNYKNTNIINQSSIINTHTEQHRLEVAKALNATSYLAGHVEWKTMEQSGVKEKMKEFGIPVFRSPDLDPLIFPINSTVELSCVQIICTMGAEKTHVLINSMVEALKNKRNIHNDI